jgi:hypothetical protein
VVVEALVRVVVVPERRIELDLRVEQRFVNALELLVIIFRALTSIRLSPIIRTNSNGKTFLYSTITSASCICSLAPDPVSPMATKRTEPSFTGRLTAGFAFALVAE